MFGIVNEGFALEAASGHEHRASHDARCPNVTEDAAFVAQAIHETSFADEVVELRPVLVRDL